ncbi:hypothetical protein LCGC14_1151700 [marine sediment metagenome]|uniref:Uncharacterized protein n=1 Tax=marine sediment metagenome TaxID=412755 RepID=A0A0F9M061_9ZZZZ
MAHISSAPEGGKFRATAAAAIDATAAIWGGAAGSLSFVCVSVNGSGELILSTAVLCDGVIDVTEGRRESATGLANFRQVIGGKRYTVIKRGQAQEIADGTLAAGDRLYAVAAGDVRVGIGGGVGAIFVGIVLEDPTVRDGNGLYLDIDINGDVVGTV